MALIKTTGNFNKTDRFLKKVNTGAYLNPLDKLGKEGVNVLSKATPIRTGTTAASWDYEIHRAAGSVTIYWTNVNAPYGVSVAVLIQYGHGTRNGGFVQGIDYINPALRPIFQKMADEVWKEVQNA